MLNSGLRDVFIVKKLSKMVCFHQSEWGVEFSHLKSEIDTFLDKGINKEEDEGIKNILIERKNEALQITEAKVNALSFWTEVKVSGNSMPEGVTYEPHTNSCRKMHSWETEPILQPGESPSTLEQFPTNNKVYHFHPNMFVRQMKRMGGDIGYIDWNFIKTLEGKEILKGYVPQKDITEEITFKTKDNKTIKKKITKKIVLGISGVTIASGFDIGQHNKNDLTRIFGSNPKLLNKFLPYAEKRREDAVNYLKKNALILTQAEAELTDKLIKNSQFNSLIKVYNKHDIPKEFKYQSIGIQTVIMSYCFQYGVYSKSANPIWEALKREETQKLVEFWEDKSKGKSYTNRRKSELQFLKKYLNSYKK